LTHGIPRQRSRALRSKVGLRNEVQGVIPDMLQIDTLSHRENCGRCETAFSSPEYRFFWPVKWGLSWYKNRFFFALWLDDAEHDKRRALTVSQYCAMLHGSDLPAAKVPTAAGA